MLSAHLMSCILDFQFLCGFYVCHLSPMMIARLQLVLASEKALWSVAYGWCGIGMGGLESSMCSHQHSSLTVPCDCLHSIKGLLPKVPSINCSAVKYMLPSGMTNDAWERHSWSFSTCLSVCMVVSSHLQIALAYLFCLAGIKPTVLLLRSQVKPMKTGDEEKGVSLVSFQDIPNWSVMWLMWVKSYACDVKLSPVYFRVKSLIRCEQSSANSLHVPSARKSPLMPR